VRDEVPLLSTTFPGKGEHPGSGEGTVQLRQSFAVHRPGHNQSSADGAEASAGAGR
jgi:hypothetical protein